MPGRGREGQGMARTTGLVLILLHDVGPGWIEGGKFQYFDHVIKEESVEWFLLSDPRPSEHHQADARRLFLLGGQLDSFSARLTQVVKPTKHVAVVLHLWSY